MHRTQNPPHSPAPAVDNSPADTLRGAAHYLAAHGWTQGTYYTDNTEPFPAACADGAIAMAVYGRRHADPFDTTLLNRIDLNDAIDVLTDYLTGNAALTDSDTGELLPIEVTEWNDRDAMTAAQVIATLHAAADDYDWAHAREDDFETYADACVWNEKQPTREGFLTWLDAR